MGQKKNLKFSVMSTRKSADAGRQQLPEVLDVDDSPKTNNLLQIDRISLADINFQRNCNSNDLSCYGPFGEFQKKVFV